MRDEDPTRPTSTTEQLDATAHMAGGYAAGALSVLNAPEMIDRVTEKIGGLPFGAGEEARLRTVDAIVMRGEELALTDGWLTAWLPRPNALCFGQHDDELSDHDPDDDEHATYAGVAILGDVRRDGSRQTVALHLTVADALDFANDIISAARTSALHAAKHGWKLTVQDEDPC